MTKKILTRDEFEDLRIKSAAKMAARPELREKALDLMFHADQDMWLHQGNWMGEPILNTAQDIMALQEMVYRTRPKYIIEVGVAWGGMLLFYSTLMEILGGEKIIAIDIFIPDDLKERINSHERLAKRIEWINASSIEGETIEKIKAIVGDCRDNLVVLDSHHTHDHVLAELRLYQQFVGKGNYLLCEDTIIEEMPSNTVRKREWGHGNNPMTALHQFLKETDDFERDVELENKLLLTSHAEGYLRRVK